MVSLLESCFRASHLTEALEPQRSQVRKDPASSTDAGGFSLLGTRGFPKRSVDCC